MYQEAKNKLAYYKTYLVTYISVLILLIFNDILKQYLHITLQYLNQGLFKI